MREMVERAGRVRLATLLALAASPLWLGACADDDPTSVGGPLFPPGAVRTFEVVLDAPQFLVADTTFDGFDPPGTSTLLVVAEDFAGALDAHALARFSELPKTVQYRDSANNNQTDTLPRFTGGDFVLVFDSATVSGGASAEIAIYTLAESWHRGSATWTLRSDTTIPTRQSWTTPGGTKARLLGTGTVTPGADSVLIPIDSATVVALRDSAALANGLLLVGNTPGTRVVAQSLGLRLRANPRPRPDTTVTTAVTVFGTTFIYTPKPQPTTLLRVGGTPSWRSALELSPAFETLSVPCPAPAPRPNCTVRLRDATVTAAELLLKPIPTVTAFQPEDTVTLQAWPILRSPLVPLQRSPLREPVSGSTTRLLAPSFAPGASADRTPVTITNYVRELLAARDSAAAPPPRSLALIGIQFPATFGFATFGSTESGADAPKLRLVLTVPEEVLRR